MQLTFDVFNIQTVLKKSHLKMHIYLYVNPAPFGAGFFIDFLKRYILLLYLTVRFFFRHPLVLDLLPPSLIYFFGNKGRILFKT